VKPYSFAIPRLLPPVNITKWLAAMAKGLEISALAIKTRQVVGLLDR